MDTTPLTTDWITSFDWAAAGPEARDSKTLSRRLATSLQLRSALLGHDFSTDEAARFGRYITALRRARGWTRSQLAEAADVDPLAIALLENAALTQDEQHSQLVVRVAHAFGLAEHDLVLSPYPAASQRHEQTDALPQHPGFVQGLRELVATLVPSRPEFAVDAALTLRGDDRTDSARSSPAVYRAEGYEVSLVAQVEDGLEWALLGSITSTDEPESPSHVEDTAEQAITVAVLRERSEIATAEVDELGYFVCAPVFSGQYDVRILIQRADGQDISILLEHVTIGS